MDSKGGLSSYMRAFYRYILQCLHVQLRKDLHPFSIVVSNSPWQLPSRSSFLDFIEVHHSTLNFPQLGPGLIKCTQVLVASKLKGNICDFGNTKKSLTKTCLKELKFKFNISSFKLQEGYESVSSSGVIFGVHLSCTLLSEAKLQGRSLHQSNICQNSYSSLVGATDKRPLM